MVAVVHVGRGRGQARLRVGRLLDERPNATVGREVDHAVARRELERPDVADGDRARGAVAAPERDEVGELELEEVVARDHEQVVVDPGSLDDELHVAHSAELVVVRGRPVVVDRHVPAATPELERRCLACVRDDMHLVDVGHGGQAVDDAVDDRATADREELLRPRIGERSQPRRIPGCEDQRLHAATAPASVSS